MWESLGFKDSPYNTNPLKVRQEDVELLVGRGSEAIEISTIFESGNNGILILSGVPGVGKTSFFNIVQYQLETQQGVFGPMLLSARHLCPVQPSDDVRTLALRALECLYKSVETYCSIHHSEVPVETKKIGKWLCGGSSTGFDLGIEILGFGGNIGRSVSLPGVQDVSFEGITDAITAIVSEVVNKLGFKGAIIALDNLENLEDSQLKSLLISFRDTLFSTPNLWWVLIGQSGLGSLIQSLDPRVFERIAGSGIEITPISLEELDEAINIRVSKFHAGGNGKAPLPKDIHKELFNTSFGEMRFVFKYSNSICTKFVEKARQAIFDKFQSLSGMRDQSKSSIKDAIDQAIATHMINDQINPERAMELLREIVENELNGLYLKPKEKEVLIKIGEKGKTRAKDCNEFGIKTMQDFSSNYLAKLAQQNLLVREQEGRAVYYRLRGIARMAHSFGLLTPKK
jgi:Cdc6-like AAA superfamily ATPase